MSNSCVEHEFCGGGGGGITITITIIITFTITITITITVLDDDRIFCDGDGVINVGGTF